VGWREVAVGYIDRFEVLMRLVNDLKGWQTREYLFNSGHHAQVFISIKGNDLTKDTMATISERPYALFDELSPSRSLLFERIECLLSYQYRGHCPHCVVPRYF
jgi:hypothetical protein